MKPKKYGVGDAVKICLRCAPGASSFKLIIEIINGALAPLTILAVASFIDGVIAFVGGNGNILPFTAAIAFIAACYACSQIGHVFSRLADKSLENALRMEIRPKIIKKHARIQFPLLENAETSDLITLVCDNAEARIAAALNNGIGIIRLAIQASGTLSLLAAHLWWALPAFIIGAAPIVLIARKGGKSIYESDAVTIKLTRKHYYLSGILTGRDTAAERTLFGYTDYINRKFSAVHLKRSNMVTKTIAVEEISINACELILNALVIAAVFALLAPAAEGELSHGLYVSLIGAMVGLSRMVTGTVSRLISDVTALSAFMRDYARFFGLPETNENQDNGARPGKNAERTGAVFESLEIRNLRFRYTPDGEYVLNGVNLIMERGRTYSLIGRNGAGKSTLTKILLGLYCNYEGEILINGADISRYGEEELRLIFSVVYQDFAKYYIPFEDNITFGGCNGREVRSAGDDFRSSLRLAELESAVENLPNKEKTPLGKIYDGGTDISGGEWQKVAIARALYANAPFIILDEPTASLSPMTESRLYGHFAEIVKEKTALLITHRLGSTKLSDVIFVLDGGVIAESGTHGGLMAFNGVYAEMFNNQRSWYDERRRP